MTCVALIKKDSAAFGVRYPDTILAGINTFRHFDFIVCQLPQLFGCGTEHADGVIVLVCDKNLTLRANTDVFGLAKRRVPSGYFIQGVQGAIKDDQAVVAWVRNNDALAICVGDDLDIMGAV